MSSESPRLLFALPVLTPVEGRPNHTSLDLLQTELNANAMAIPSHRGGGAHGHLQLTLSADAYLAIAGVPFLAPQDPGDAPVHALGATGPQITETNRQFLESRNEFRLYSSVSQALKKQLLNAVDPLYTATLKVRTFGYANVSTHALLTHLHTTYGAITDDDLANNRTHMESSWNPDDPIEQLWERVADCLQLAIDGNDPITPAFTIHAVLTIMKKTGIFSDAVRDWRKRPVADRTWIHFKTHFSDANVERLRLLTASQGGFHSANAAIAAAAALTAAANAANAANAPPPPPNARANVPPPGHHYCWSHGLGRNPAHTSATCSNPAPNHDVTANFHNMKGGNNTISRARNERAIYQHPSRSSTPPAPPATS